MRFTAIILAAATFIGLSSSSPTIDSSDTVTKSSVSCRIGVQAKINEPALRDCFDGYRNGTIYLFPKQVGIYAYSVHSLY
jgi:hypothetical protein